MKLGEEMGESGTQLKFGLNRDRLFISMYKYTHTPSIGKDK